MKWKKERSKRKKEREFKEVEKTGPGGSKVASKKEDGPV
jgi:hypothetical protein